MLDWLVEKYLPEKESIWTVAIFIDYWLIDNKNVLLIGRKVVAVEGARSELTGPVICWLIQNNKFKNTTKKLHNIQGVFLHWASPKKLKYGKPRLGESTLM